MHTYDNLTDILNADAFNAVYYQKANHCDLGYDYNAVKNALTRVIIQDGEIERDKYRPWTGPSRCLEFTNCRLVDVVFKGSWDSLFFKNCLLKNVSFVGTDLVWVDFTDCSTENITIVGKKCLLSIVESQISNQDFAALKVQSIDVTYSKLHNANFSCVKAISMDFHNVDFSRCDMSHPAGWKNTSFVGGNFRSNTGWPVLALGQRSDGYTHVACIEPLSPIAALFVIKAGCRHFCYNDAKKHWGNSNNLFYNEDRAMRNKESSLITDLAWTRMEMLLKNTGMRLYKSRAEYAADKLKTKAKAASGAKARAQA